MAPIVIFTRLTARPGRRTELLAAFTPLLDAVAGEPGTEVFEMHTARDDADVVLFYEAYRDEDALATHRESEAVRAVVPRLGDLLVAPPEITYAHPAPVVDGGGPRPERQGPDGTGARSPSS